MSHLQPNRTPGITCPRCNQTIPISIEQLLTSHSIVCPSCCLVLTIDKQESKKAMEALSKVKQAQEEVERKSTFNG